MEKNREPNRRGFFHKLAGLAALGSISSLILSHKVDKGWALAGTGTAGQIAFWSGSDTITGNDRLKWDNNYNNFAAGWATVTSGVVSATISGGGASGNTNKVTDHWGTVGGGFNNQAGDGAGTISDKSYATVGGGASNTASNQYTTIGGGTGNTASGDTSTIGGGASNTASSQYATIGGGQNNNAGSYAAVGGGQTNNASASLSTISGGEINTASGSRSTVCGGTTNTASGNRSTIGGGDSNTAAGDYSFAAGRRAKINAAHDGAFLYADQNDLDFNSSAANEFAIRCTGGARFVTAIDGSGNPTQTIAMNTSGCLGVGITTPVAPVHVKSSLSNPAIRLENENNFVGEFIYCYSSGSHIPFFSGRRARGTTASPTAVQTDDILMRYGGSGYGTSGFPGGNRAILEFRAAEAWTDAAQGTYILLSTTPTGATGTTERIRITANGSITPPSDGSGSIGEASKRWSDLYVVNLHQGDLIFQNGVRSTEEGDGIAFYNPEGSKIAVLDSGGNFHIKGDIIKDL